MDTAWLWLILPLCGVMSAIASGPAMIVLARLFPLKMSMKQGAIFGVGYGACLIWGYTAALFPLSIVIPNAGPPGQAPNPIPFAIIMSVFAMPIVLVRVAKAYEDRLEISATRALLLALIQTVLFALLTWWACSAVPDYYYSVQPPEIPLPGLQRG
jgi:hypothetical protein